MGEGLAVFTSPSNQLTNVSLGFRSTQLAALLFAAETEVSSLRAFCKGLLKLGSPLPLPPPPRPLQWLQVGLFAISLYHTRVRVDLSNVSLISAEGGLNDNIWHQIDVSITANRFVCVRVCMCVCVCMCMCVCMHVRACVCRTSNSLFLHFSLTLTVDRDSAATFLPAALSPPPSLLSTMLAVGGTPTPQGHTVSESFRGCMDAVTVDEQ